MLRAWVYGFRKMLRDTKRYRRDTALVSTDFPLMIFRQYNQRCQKIPRRYRTFGLFFNDFPPKQSRDTKRYLGDTAVLAGFSVVLQQNEPEMPRDTAEISHFLVGLPRVQPPSKTKP